MANTSALLLNLLTTNADINYYTQQQIYWSNKYEANSAKLAKQVKYEEKWNDAYDDCYYAEDDKKVKVNGVEQANQCECTAIAYADYKVEEYDEDLKNELADLDLEYDTMKTMYVTVLEQLRAQKEGQQEATSNAAQDTGLLN